MATLLGLCFAGFLSLAGCTGSRAAGGAWSSIGPEPIRTLSAEELAAIRKNDSVVVRLRTGDNRSGTWIGFSMQGREDGDSLAASAGSGIWTLQRMPATVAISADSLRSWSASNRWPPGARILIQQLPRRNAPEMIDQIPLGEVASVDVVPLRLDSGTGIKLISFVLVAAAVVAVHIFAGFGQLGL